MVLKVGSLTRWSQISTGNVLDLVAEQARTVRLDLNTTAPTRVSALVDGTEYLLGVVDGIETIEFHTPGPSVIAFDTEGEVWWDTRDGQTDRLDIVEESFVTIMNRQARNPDLERMELRMMANMERRLNAQAQEYELALEQQRELINAQTGEATGIVRPSATSGDTGSSAAAASQPPAAEPEAEGEADAAGTPSAPKP